MQNRGFTMLEVLLTVGLLSAIAGIGLFATVDMYRSTSLLEERGIVVAMLERARSHSMNNLYGIPHGVCYDGERYVVFRGSTIEEHAVATWPVTGMPDCFEGIVFTQLTGTTTPTTISIQGSGLSLEILVNAEGTVVW